MVYIFNTRTHTITMNVAMLFATICIVVLAVTSNVVGTKPDASRLEQSPLRKRSIDEDPSTTTFCAVRCLFRSCRKICVDSDASCRCVDDHGICECIRHR